MRTGYRSHIQVDGAQLQVDMAEVEQEEVGMAVVAQQVDMAEVEQEEVGMAVVAQQVDMAQQEVEVGLDRPALLRPATTTARLLELLLAIMAASPSPGPSHTIPETTRTTSTSVSPASAIITSDRTDIRIFPTSETQTMWPMRPPRKPLRVCRKSL